MSLNLRKRFTEIILVALILLNIWDFLGPWLGFISLPGDVDFFKKLMSWTIVAHLFYEVSFTWLFFGKKHEDNSGIFSNKILNLGILTCFLLFSIKNLVGVSHISLEEVYYFKELVQFLAINGAMIEIVSFYIAGIGLILLSLYMTLFTKIDKRSLLGNLGFHDKNWLVEFGGVILIFTSFYILVFDLIIEWLAIAVDSSLIVLGIIFYMILFTTQLHKKFGDEGIIFRIGNFGENFEEHFLKFFHDKKHVFLGLSGLLVLHLLTEISNFLLPYFGLTNSFYFAKLELVPLYGIFRTEFFIDKLVVFGYILNIIALLGLVIIPAVLWYEVYKNKHKIIPQWMISIFLGSLVFFILNPLFKFKHLDYKTGLIGTGIMTKSLLVQDLSFVLMLVGALIMGLFLLSFIKFFAHMMYHITVLSAIAFFGYYLGLFYWSTMKYFIDAIMISFNNAKWFFVFFFSIFILVKILFVIIGFISYLVQLSEKHLF